MSQYVNNADRNETREMESLLWANTAESRGHISLRDSAFQALNALRRPVDFEDTKISFLYFQELLSSDYDNRIPMSQYVNNADRNETSEMGSLPWAKRGRVSDAVSLRDSAFQVLNALRRPVDFEDTKI